MKKTVLLILFTMLLFTSCNRMNNGSEPEQSAVSNVGSGASQSEEININNFTISEIIYPKINDISTDYEVEKLTISSILINEAYNLKFINDNNILFNKEVASGNDYSYPLYKFNIQSEELILLDEDFVMAPHAYLKVIDVNNFYLIGKYEFLTIKNNKVDIKKNYVENNVNIRYNPDINKVVYSNDKGEIYIADVDLKNAVKLDCPKACKPIWVTNDIVAFSLYSSNQNSNDNIGACIYDLNKNT